MERRGVGRAKMSQKPFKCYIAGFSVLVTMSKQVNQDIILSTTLDHQAQCQSFQMMSSQCLETPTVIYTIAFSWCFLKFLSQYKAPPPLVSWRVHPTLEPSFLLDSVTWGTVFEAHIKQGRNFLDICCPLTQVP